MSEFPVTRRDVLRSGSAAFAAAWAHMAMPGFAFPGQQEDEQLVPFLDMPRTRPNRLDWEHLTEWITPQDQIFNVQHYSTPELDEAEHTLTITGLVETPKTLTMEQIKALPKTDQLMTLECSGNGASKFFMDAIYNAKWTGTPLKPLLEECGLKPEAKDVVFYGADGGEETLRKGTRQELTIEAPFGRSMSVEEALNDDLLLAYEYNGRPLEQRNGFPLRLIVPGWYGIANVKWLTRIEVLPDRFMGRFMGRDYVTVREHQWGDRTVNVETSVTRMNLKSIIARVTRRPAGNGTMPVKAYGAVWNDGTPIQKVEVKVDDGPWQPAELDEEPRAEFCWTFFSFDAGNLKPGKHTLVSRATDVDGNVQPTADDPEIANKKTYWEAYQQWPREIELKA